MIFQAQAAKNWVKNEQVWNYGHKGACKLSKCWGSSWVIQTQTGDYTTAATGLLELAKQPLRMEVDTCSMIKFTSEKSKKLEQKFPQQ